VGFAWRTPFWCFVSARTATLPARGGVGVILAEGPDIVGRRIGHPRRVCRTRREQASRGAENGVGFPRPTWRAVVLVCPVRGNAQGPSNNDHEESGGEATRGEYARRAAGGCRPISHDDRDCQVAHIGCQKMRCGNGRRRLASGRASLLANSAADPWRCCALPLPCPRRMRWRGHGKDWARLCGDASCRRRARAEGRGRGAGRRSPRRRRWLRAAGSSSATRRASAWR